MIRRNITQPLLEALSDSPVVFLNGARQTGKSTLTRHLADGPHPARYLTLDDATTLAAVQQDPDGFIRRLGGSVVLDEVQRAPDLFLAIKAAVDRNRAPGRFLLTGSADVLLLPRVSESLAGRMEILTLWPFSQGELEGRKETFVDALFEEDLPLSQSGRALLHERRINFRLQANASGSETCGFSKLPVYSSKALLEEHEHARDDSQGAKLERV